MSYWQLKSGEKNTICDVEGVLVGHYTIDNNWIQTGLTVIRPHPDNIYREKLLASCHRINGYGKPVGMEQIRELGTLETPIVLTNTLAIGEATQGLIQYMIEESEEIGIKNTVNPIVMECNDGKLNDIRQLSIAKEDVKATLNNTKTEFEQGAVGAGRGMVCYDLKGGIGSSSRIVPYGNKNYTLGILTLTNFGTIEDLIVQGKPIGRDLSSKIKGTRDQGSIVTILATDAPLSTRQLNRLCRRVQNGIGRTGAFCSSGSGEFVLGFSTAYRISTNNDLNFNFLHDQNLDLFFKATVEATEEAILNSLLYSETVTGFKHRTIHSLKSLMPEISLD